MTNEEVMMWVYNYDFGSELFEPVRRKIYQKTCITFSLQSLKPNLDYVNKLHIVTKNALRDEVNLLIQNRLVEANKEEPMFLAFYKNLTFTVLLRYAITSVIEKDDYCNFPIWVFPEVAELILERKPDFFNNLSINFIE